MRVAPIGLWFGGASNHALKKEAKKSATVPHTHELGLDSAVIMSKAVSMTVKMTDIDNDSFLDELIRISSTKEIRLELQKIRVCLKEKLDAAAI